ncbi:MAG TPA: hypothetical protein VEH00_04895 [Steroidobacteraceae bacterium]|nr:hypothetical protein [Steroidobacteraceae bacterium]
MTVFDSTKLDQLGDNFNVELYCANAGDKRAQLSRFANTNPLADNQVYILPATPRTIGIKFTQHF